MPDEYPARFAESRFRTEYVRLHQVVRDSQRELLALSPLGSFGAGIFTPDSPFLHFVGFLLAIAISIWQREREQADAVQAGRRVRDQLLFEKYLAQRAVDPSYTFRKHLRALGGAIEA